MEKIGVKCLYDHIITTANKRGKTIILNEAEELLSRQTVLAAGPNASVLPGDEIEINTRLFEVKNSFPPNGIGPDKIKVIVPVEVIDGKECLFISSREIKWVYDNNVDPFVSTTT